jgi:hypothetical protein
MIGYAGKDSMDSLADEAARLMQRGDTTERTAHEITSSIGNDTCFDCDANVMADPWISTNHATVLCLPCAGVHRSLGVHISFVRSINLDSLKGSERELMRRGGNARFRAFLEAEEQCIPRHVWLALPVDLRYHTPAADLYRRQLRAEMEGGQLPTELERVRPPPKAPTAPSPLGRSPEGKLVDTEQCELCRDSFNILNRRHHCRKCGRHAKYAEPARLTPNVAIARDIDARPARTGACAVIARRRRARDRYRSSV